MTKTSKTVLYLVLLLAGAVGHRTATTPAVVHHWHGIESLIYTEDPTVQAVGPLWEKEVSRRFPDALVVFAHGGSLAGDWLMEYPGGPQKLVVVANALVAKYPGREIVFVTCNPGHYVINIPHVHTALGDVWKVPDRNNDEARDSEPSDVGNIYEFN